jgi:hypothetical protein
MSARVLVIAAALVPIGLGIAVLVNDIRNWAGWSGIAIGLLVLNAALRAKKR